ncbi:MAG: inositol phosphorylceramide synthase [Chlorobi bacterium]|nr:inositol phosphorylceramide synthase [Chlorobiota bacterium]
MTMKFQRFTQKNILINILLIVSYIAWNTFVGGMRTEHWFLIVLWITMFYVAEKTRKFILAFSIFIVYWIIYDSMRIIPNYEVSAVHIKQPYELEKSLFGIFSGGVLLTPNEYFAIHHNSVLDILAGLFYINWVPIPLAFAAYLYVKDKYLFTKFSLVFLIVNIFGFIIYYLYPAAPPWYVQLYGFDLHIGIPVPGNSAGLSRFDKLLGVPIFQSIYNKNANVLAAMPSLHATYPLIVLFYGIKKGLKKMNLLFVIFMFGIWFSAVYASHHYIIDLIAGVILALTLIFLFEKLSEKEFADTKIKNFVKKIS